MMRSRIAVFLVVFAVYSSPWLTAAPRLSPEDSGRTHRSRIAAGSQFACHAVADGTVWCWGANQFGQLGDGTFVFRSTPVRVGSPLTGFPAGVVSVAAGFVHACALHSDGRVRCWGENSRGQLGDGSRINRSTPVLASGLSQAIAITAGAYHTCALRAINGGAIIDHETPFERRIVAVEK
ncbi:MAG: hypothetical protein FJW30_15155 [Acidobacteria bacterium]|nr:hypothetical protein [Acidobacteriota bacterium]